MAISLKIEGMKEFEFLNNDRAYYYDKYVDKEHIPKKAKKIFWKYINSKENQYREKKKFPRSTNAQKEYDEGDVFEEGCPYCGGKIIFKWAKYRVHSYSSSYNITEIDFDVQTACNKCKRTWNSLPSTKEHILNWKNAQKKRVTTKYKEAKRKGLYFSPVTGTFVTKESIEKKIAYFDMLINYYKDILIHNLGVKNITEKPTKRCKQ